jgi:hypothetical protein
MRGSLALAVCLFTLASPLAGQMRHVEDKDLAAYLSGVTERGRALYAYDQCAWHGTDAIFALHPDMHGATHYICLKALEGWDLVFPRWNAAHDRLLVAYEAVEAGGPENYTAKAYDPPREGPQDLIAKERALELAISDFGEVKRQYNTAILPVGDGSLYVYLYPAQTRADVWPLGGDVRYTISADGRQIIEKRQLHKAILDMQFDPKMHIVSGVHIHVLSDVPEDTDVFYVLTRKPSIPEFIGAGKRMFTVNTDGGIQITRKK